MQKRFLAWKIIVHRTEPNPGFLLYFGHREGLDALFRNDLQRGNQNVVSLAHTITLQVYTFCREGTSLTHSISGLITLNFNAEIREIQDDSKNILTNYECGNMIGAKSGVNIPKLDVVLNGGHKRHVAKR
jgi:hypothetical protein